ncbi:MAG TPA: prolyl oligopeptidase family serine peptidase, partial [Gemmatimonadaceae bacterium]
WSPGSKRIAFWRFDQSEIPVYPLLDDRTLYPTIVPVRYPKAGEPNSVVRIGVVTASSGSVTWMDLGSDTGATTGGYVARLSWVGNDSLTLQQLPRRQDRIDLLMRSAATGRGRTVLTERADSAWVDVAEDAPRWVNGDTMFLWPSERSGWRQYYLFRRDGSLVRRVTRDGVDVTNLVDVDAHRGLAYVIEAGPTPAQRQLWAYDISRAGSGTQMTHAPGTHDVTMAPGAGYLVDSYSTAAAPPVVTLQSLSAVTSRRVLATDTTLEARIAALHARPPQFFEIPMPDGTRLDALRIVPPSFDSTRRYPVLMYAYGGPGSQTVLDAFGGAEYAWYQMLAQRGFVIVTVDNRGTGGRGSAFRRTVYLHLGLRESQDQIDAARWLTTRPWVDAAHIGIWGWSYGGYLSAMTAFRGGPLFRAAISVAPVADWRFYDDIYTERYMRTPNDNPDGYHVSSTLRYVDGLSARYLLVYGSGDDNVHPQNSIRLANRLIEAGKLFQMMVYPNRTHAIAGGNTRDQLYETLTRFIEEQLGEQRERADAPADAVRR